MDSMDRPKGTRYSEKEWRRYKDEIIAYHDQDRKTHAQIVQILGERGFYVTPRQLKSKLKVWGCTRNIKLRPEQVKFLLEIFDRRRRQGKRSGVRFGKMTLNEKQLENLQRTLHRHQQKNTVKSPTAAESFGINVFTPYEPALSPHTGATFASPIITSLVLPRQDDIGTIYQPYGPSSNHGAVATQPPMLLEEGNTAPHLNSQEDSDDLDLFENEISPEIINEIGIILEDAVAPDVMSEDEDKSFRTARLLPKELQQLASSCSEGKDFAVDQDDALLGTAETSDLFRQFFGEEGNWESIQEARPSPAKTIQSLYSTPNREFESSFRPPNSFLSYSPSEWGAIVPDDSFLNTSMATPNLPQLLENMNLPPLSPSHCSTQNIESHDHSRSASQDIGDTDRRALGGENGHEDLGVHLMLLRQCMGYHHKEAAVEIFKDLLKGVLERSPQAEIQSALEEVFKGKVLQFDEAEARFDAAILERQQQHGFDHPATVQMCIGFVFFLLRTADYKQEGDNFKLKAVKHRLERARKLLEKALKTGFDDKVVRETLEADWEKATEGPELRPSATHETDETDLMEIYATGCTKRPHLLHAIRESITYTEVYTSCSIFEALEDLVAVGLVVKCKTDDGEDAYYRPLNKSLPRDWDDKNSRAIEEEEEDDEAS